MLHKKPQLVRKYRLIYTNYRKAYGEERRIVEWNTPLVTYWSRVPLYLKGAWHNSFSRGRKNE